MGADVAQAELDLGDAPGVGGGLGLGEQRGALGIGGEHGLDQARRPVRRLLGDAADPGILRPGDRAVIRRELAQHHPEQGGLARAVAPDEPDLVPRRNGGGGLVEQQPALDAMGEVVDMQHGRNLNETAQNASCRSYGPRGAMRIECASRGLVPACGARGRTV